MHTWQHEYGTDVVKAGLLTLEQYGEFYDIIPLIEDDWWCLATPWKTPSRSPRTYNTASVWYVYTDGDYYYSSYNSTFGVRPALNLNPLLLVAWEDDGVSEDGTRDLNILSEFTLDELLGEIKRRYEEESRLYGINLTEQTPKCTRACCQALQQSTLDSMKGE